MGYFSIDTGVELAELLLVAPQEVDEVLRNRRRYYRSVEIAKRGGGSRVLRVPDGRLKVLQDKVRRHVLDRIPALDCVHGGVKGRSVVTNAMPHVRKDVVFTLDVKDFFPSVGPTAVSAIFRILGFGPEALTTLVDATTWDNQLPQGSPTSVGMANLAMHKVDVRLSRLAKQHGFAYTRYIDDLAFSGGWRLLDFRRLIQRIVEEEGFKINPKKLKTMLAGNRQIVTGIVVNERLNLPREQRDSIRQLVAEIASARRQPTIAINRIRGKLAWLSSVNPQKAVRLRCRTPLLGRNRTSHHTPWSPPDRAAESVPD